MERQVGVWLDGSRVVAAEVTKGVVSNIFAASSTSPNEALAIWAKSRHHRGAVIVALDVPGSFVREVTVDDAPEDAVRAQIRRQLRPETNGHGALAVCGRFRSDAWGDGGQRVLTAGALGSTTLASLGSGRGGRKARFTLAPFVLPSGDWLVMGWERCWASVVIDGVPVRTREFEAPGTRYLVDQVGGERVLEAVLTGAAGGGAAQAVDRWLDALARELAETQRSWTADLGRAVGPWTLVGSESHLLASRLGACGERYACRLSMPRSVAASGGYDTQSLGMATLAIAAAVDPPDDLATVTLDKTRPALADELASLLRRGRKPILCLIALIVVALGIPVALGKIQLHDAQSKLTTIQVEAQRLAPYAVVGTYDTALSSTIDKLKATEPKWAAALVEATSSAPPGVSVTQVSFAAAGNGVAVTLEADDPTANRTVPITWADSLATAGMTDVVVPQLAVSTSGITFTMDFQVPA